MVGPEQPGWAVTMPVTGCGASLWPRNPPEAAADLSEGDPHSSGLCRWVLLTTMPSLCSTTCSAKLMGGHCRNHCH